MQPAVQAEKKSLSSIWNLKECFLLSTSTCAATGPSLPEQPAVY